MAKLKFIPIETLLEMGYTNVLDYKAGKQGWTSAGLELAQ
jgi:rhodanese-related sulfurtransferase